MASITVRNLDDNVKKRLRKRAAENGRSLEAEVRDILSRSAASGGAGARPRTGLDIVRPLMEFVEKHGGIELEIPPRTPMRPLPFRQEEPRPFRRKK